ncbi:hypothetical protein BKA62DRAFT_668143 [Auriculariales sp. MPI-PUGE-AT-0066]|nr:hypothetical protein BKA62DRAFT_668143 [Auriculariales sp. MPI-PUGE-AT-0066]
MTTSTQSPIKPLGASAEIAQNSPDYDNRAIYMKLGLELSPKVAGPMPVKELLNRFLPLKITAAQRRELAQQSSFAGCPKSKRGSQHQNNTIIANLRKTANDLMADMVFQDTQDVHPSGHWHMKDPYPATRPDFCIYHVSDLQPTNMPGSTGMATRSSTATTTSKTLSSINDASLVVVNGDLKPTDVFNDTGDTFVLNNDLAHLTLGQLGQMFHKIMAFQNRMHLFSLVVTADGFARIIRWDRAVVVVSERLKYTGQHQQELAEFFYRISRVRKEHQGYDTTIQPAFEADIFKAAPHLDDFDTNHQIYNQPPCFPPSDGKCNTGKFLAISVPDGEEKRIVIARRLQPVVEDPMGRATRGYIAYDLTSKRITYLKDSWPAASHVTHEHIVLKDLAEKRVPYVPTFVCGGPIVDQQSLEENYLEQPWNIGCRMTEQRAHQRFLVREVGKPLAVSLDPQSCQSHQILHRLSEAITAHKAAYDKAGYLHRDISEGNVLHVKSCDEHGTTRTQALLIDWDLAKTILTSTTRRERTGTWYFMSVNLLGDNALHQSLSDDLESFVWLLLYLYLRHLPWSMENADSKEPKDVEETLLKIFEPSGIHSGYGKMALLSYRRPHLEFNCEPATMCIQGLLGQLDLFLQEVNRYKAALRKRREQSNKQTKADEPDTAGSAFGSHEVFLSHLREFIKLEWPRPDSWADRAPLGFTTIPRSPIVSPSQLSHLQRKSEQRLVRQNSRKMSMLASSSSGTKRKSETLVEEVECSGEHGPSASKKQCLAPKQRSSSRSGSG